MSCSGFQACELIQCSDQHHRTQQDQVRSQAEVLSKGHMPQERYVPSDVCRLQCRALTACVMWEIAMQDLQPNVHWQEDVADLLVRQFTFCVECRVVLCCFIRQSTMHCFDKLCVAKHNHTGMVS